MGEPEMTVEAIRNPQDAAASYRGHVDALRARWSPEVRAYAEQLGAEIDFARRLRELREVLDLSLRAAGKITGEDPGDFSRMENRLLKPSVERADRIMGHLRNYAATITVAAAEASATRTPLTTVREAAQYLCAIYDERDRFTILKLQKLLYYGQGYALAIFGRPLFDAKIKAWAAGPVVPEVRYMYDNAGQPLPRPTDLDLLQVPSNVRTVLDRVYAEYGPLTAWGLVDRTHVERPWAETQKNQEIPIAKIATFFVERLAMTTPPVRVRA